MFPSPVGIPQAKRGLSSGTACSLLPFLFRSVSPAGASLQGRDFSHFSSGPEDSGFQWWGSHRLFFPTLHIVCTLLNEWWNGVSPRYPVYPPPHQRISWELWVVERKWFQEEVTCPLSTGLAKTFFVFFSSKNLRHSFNFHQELYWAMSSLFCSTELKMLVTQSCPVLCDPMDCSPPGSSVHGVLQARMLRWVAISFLLSIFRQLHNSTFLKLFIFLSKELFQVPFTVFQGTEIFFH